MRADLIRRLADGLEQDATNDTGLQFDMSLWAGPSVNAHLGAPHIFPLKDGAEVPVFEGISPELLPPVSCGTKGCAFGFGVLSGMFDKEGLHATYSERTRYSPGGVRSPEVVGYVMSPSIRDDEGRLLTDFEAAMFLFDISNQDADYLFGPESYDTVTGHEAELMVARRLRDFADGEIDHAYHPAFCKDDEEDDDMDDGEDPPVEEPTDEDHISPDPKF